MKFEMCSGIKEYNARGNNVHCTGVCEGCRFEKVAVENITLKEIPTEALFGELAKRGKSKDELVLFDPNYRLFNNSPDSGIEADLAKVNPVLSKYGINLRPAPVHSSEKVIVSKCMPSL